MCSPQIGRTPNPVPVVSSDSSHHPVQLVCAQIVYIITMKQRSAKVIFEGGMLPDPPSRVLASAERRLWAENINRPLFNSFNLASF